MTAMRLAGAIILIAISIYIFSSFRFNYGKKADFEIGFIDGHLTFDSNDKVEAVYDSRLPIPFWNLNLHSTFILPKWQSDSIAKSYDMKDFLINENAKSVILSLPSYLPGLGDYRLTAFAVTSVKGQVSFYSPTFENFSDEKETHTYMLENGQAATEKHAFKDQKILFKILNNEYRFSSEPDSNRYYLDKEGRLFQSPYFAQPIEEILLKTTEMQKSLEGKSILLKVKSHIFFGFRAALKSARLLYDKGLDFKLVQLETDKNESGDSFSSQYIFRRDELSILIINRKIISGGTEVQTYFFMKNELEYSQSPVIWSQLLENQQRFGSEQLKPDAPTIRSILADFKFLLQLD